MDNENYLNYYRLNTDKRTIRENVLICHNRECAYCSDKPTRVVASNQYKPRVQSYELCGSDFIPLCEEDLKEYIKNAKTRTEGRNEPLIFWEITEDGYITELNIKVGG